MGFLYLKIKDLLKSVLQLVPVCEVPYVGRGSQSSLRPSLGSWLRGRWYKWCSSLSWLLFVFWPRRGLWCYSGGEWVQHQLKKHIYHETTEKEFFLPLDISYFSLCESKCIAWSFSCWQKKHKPAPLARTVTSVSLGCTKALLTWPNNSPLCDLLPTAQGRELWRGTGTGALLGQLAWVLCGTQWPSSVIYWPFWISC